MIQYTCVMYRNYLHNSHKNTKNLAFLIHDRLKVRHIMKLEDMKVISRRPFSREDRVYQREIFLELKERKSRGLQVSQILECADYLETFSKSFLLIQR